MTFEGAGIGSAATGVLLAATGLVSTGTTDKTLDEVEGRSSFGDAAYRAVAARDSS